MNAMMTVYIEKAGTLEALITEEERMSLTHLKIVGEINNADLSSVLDDMCSSEVSFDSDDLPIIAYDEPPFLKVLDLGDCTVVDGLYFGDFAYYSKLEELIFPKNVIQTSEDAFSDSFSLKKVILPDTLKKISYGTFSNCSELEAVNLPDSLTEIGDFAFSDCTSLKEVTIPRNVSVIGCAAFHSCTGIERFTVDPANPNFITIDGVIYSSDRKKLVAFPCGYKGAHFDVVDGTECIGVGAFAGSKISTISFPQSLKTIEPYSFQFCDHLIEVQIPDSVIEIGELAFRYCPSLTRVQLSSNIKVLREQIFTGTPNLKRLVLPRSVRVIKPIALSWAQGLEELILNDGLEVIEDDLCKCGHLKYLYISKTVREIRSEKYRTARVDNTSFKVEVDKDSPYFIASNGLLYTKDWRKAICVYNKESNALVLDKRTRIIGPLCCSGYTKVQSITLPEGLIEIGSLAFSGCSSIERIDLPQSVQKVSSNAFVDCDNLKSLVVNASIPPEIKYNEWHQEYSCFDDTSDCVLYVPATSVEAYKASWLGFKDIRPLFQLL